MSFDGTALGYISTSIYAEGLAVVGNEVWFGGENSYSIGRLTLDGNPLPNLSVGNYAQGLAVVGQEVWFGGSTSYSINRVKFDGTALPSIGIGADQAESIAVVGNEVWWWGASSWSKIHRMSFDGTALGYISTSIYAEGLAVVGNEVWFGGENSYSIGRFTLDGDPLPNVSVGNYAQGLAVVPEPATLALLALGGLAVLRRRRKGHPGCPRTDATAPRQHARKAMLAGRMIVTMGVLVMVGLNPAGAGYPQTREYLLGDMDGIHYDGPGSIDDVYVDPALWAFADLGVGPAVHFDVAQANQDVPFTFLFPLGPGETITGAMLIVGLRATDNLYTNDWLVLHPDDGTVHWGGDTSGIYEFPNLGWTPLSYTNTTVCSVDLADIDGDDRLPWLQDGNLNVHITDDTAVDFARLTVEVVPGPATLSLLALGGLTLIRRRRNPPTSGHGDD
jgi:hypothetical protein